jgi:hypothetical protein
MTDFVTSWRSFHPSGPPIAHILRDLPEEHWIRFHSLPLSKRYAETPEERQIVLERANTLASRVLGEGSGCWLVQADPNFGDATDDSGPYCSITKLDLGFQFEHRDVEDECTYRIYSKQVTWISGAFDELISHRAEDLLPVPTMWVSPDNGAAFAPYDGGSDLFLATAHEAAKLKRDFTGWLSAHPRGL